MIGAEMKRRVDTALNEVWAGGITSPIVVLEQITYLMFMKLLDDRYLKAEAEDKVLQARNRAIGWKTWTETVDNNLRWHVFKHYDPERLFDNIKNCVFPFLKSLGEGKDTAFGRLVKDAGFLIPSAWTLTRVVECIDGMDMNDQDVMGDVYEYLLSKTSVTGKKGQFRTPRHIIDMIVEMMKPKMEDSILDPATGSGGFLLSSAAYIRKHQKKEMMEADKMCRFKSDLFTGMDTDLSMLRIGAMNMMLQGIDEPRLVYQDALSDENKERDQYSLILANPPFAGSVAQEDVRADLFELGKTGRTELLFVALCLKMLKAGGRCACIVPNGVLFGTTDAHVGIRRELVEKHKLQAVITMPSGVFRPYTRVYTAILIFTKTDAGGTDNVWFYDMKADGYSLDDRRSEIEENDIPDILERFFSREKEAERERTEKSFLVSKEEIAENDYNLSIRKYREADYDGDEEFPTPLEVMNNLRELDVQIAQTMEEIGEMLGL